MNFILTLFSTHFIGVFNGPPTLESWKFRILKPELDSLTNLDPILKTKISYSIGSSLHHCFQANFQGIQMLSTFQKNLLALLLLLDLTYKRCNINLVCETHGILFSFSPLLSSVFVKVRELIEEIKCAFDTTGCNTVCIYH